MNKRIKYVITLDIFLIIISIFGILNPFLGILNLRNCLLILLLSYSFINAFKFLLKKDYTDFEYLYSCLSGCLFALIMYFVKINTNKNLALFILLWVFVSTLIKLIKCDNYHDNNNKLWISKLANITIFMIIGFVTAINLGNGRVVNIITISYFFFINYILDFMHDIFEMIRG